jgi:hypothetical protein
MLADTVKHFSSLLRPIFETRKNSSEHIIFYPLTLAFLSARLYTRHKSASGYKESEAQHGTKTARRMDIEHASGRDIDGEEWAHNLK